MVLPTTVRQSGYPVPGRVLQIPSPCAKQVDSDFIKETVLHGSGLIR